MIRNNTSYDVNRDKIYTYIRWFYRKILCLLIVLFVDYESWLRFPFVPSSRGDSVAVSLIDAKGTKSGYPYLSTDVWFEVAKEIQDLHLPVVFVNQRKGLTVEWLQEFLQGRTEPAIILTANNLDKATPGTKELDELIRKDDLIIRVYATNPKYITNKLRALPLGPKFQYSSTDFFGEEKHNVKHLNEAGAGDASATRKLHMMSKKKTVLVTQMRKAGNNIHHRAEHLKALRSQLSASNITEGKRTDFPGFLKQVKDAAFVFSPPGNGFDCHRSYEALYMGSVPIVMSSAVDDMFDGLPVWLVSDYSEVTDEKLIEKHDYFYGQDRGWNYEMLYAPFWVEKLKLEINKPSVSLMGFNLRSAEKNDSKSSLARALT